MIKLNKAFTLVELIVVVTIISILGAIGFAAYSGFLEGVRDVNRTTNLQSIYDSLKMYNTKGKAPRPEDYIVIQSSGTTIAYQGNIGKTILDKIEINKSLSDPIDNTAYTYYVTKNRKYIQTMGFLENTDYIETLDKSFSGIVTDLGRYPKVIGDELGILTDTGGVVIQDIESIKTNGILDIQNTTKSFYSYLRDKEYLIGTGAVLNKLKDSAKVGGKRCSIVNNNLNCIMEEFLFSENLLGSWDFEAEFNDESENHNNGIGKYGVFTEAIDQNSGRGRYAKFDGVDDFVRVIDDSVFHVNNATISLWFKQDISTGNEIYGLFSKDHVGQADGGHFTIKSNNGKIRTRIQEKDPGGSHTKEGPVLSSLGISLTDWVQVTVVFGTLDGFKVYVNGDLYAEDPFQGGIAGNGQDIVIGASTDIYSGSDSDLREYFKGNIDNVMFFNRALYANEVKKLYDAQK